MKIGSGCKFIKCIHYRFLINYYTILILINFAIMTFERKKI